MHCGDNKAFLPLSSLLQVQQESFICSEELHQHLPQHASQLILQERMQRKHRLIFWVIQYLHKTVDTFWRYAHLPKAALAVGAVLCLLHACNQYRLLKDST